MNPTENTNPNKLTESEAGEARVIIDKLSKAYAKKVVGQDELRLSMVVALIAGGHVLLESVPGLAKTLAAKTLAEAANGSFSRIQCTPDLLPSDIIGTQIFNYGSSDFETKIGPVHANFVLLDEINRSSAKTQSAMLEVMQEHTVSVDGKTFLQPTSNATRAQFATIISRYLAAVTPADGPEEPDPDTPDPTPTDPDMPTQAEPDPPAGAK